MSIPISVPSLSLEGKVAIVTGGGTGIGKSITLEFAKAGADVVVASRRLAVLEEAAEEVRALGRRSLAIQTDVSRKADVDNLVQRTMDEFGVIDILVNDAGIAIGERGILEVPEDEWDRVIDINLKSCYLCCQAVGKRMVERKKGNIINISSGSAWRGEASLYGTSKAGMIRLTMGLARELGPYNIRVNTIAPGAIKTDMTRHRYSNPEVVKQREATIMLRRRGEPTDIGTVALFLASDASNYITGQTIVVDGGLLA